IRLIELLRTRAQAHMTAREFEAAERTLRRALALAPSDEESRRQLADLLRLRAHERMAALKPGPDDAEKSLRAALALQPRDEKSRHRLLELLRLRARDFVSAGKPAPAEKTLRRALAFAPRDKEARRGLLDLMRARAERHSSAGEPAKAEQALRRALAFAPDDNEARRRLVELLRSRLEQALSRDDPAATDKALRAALAFSPRDAEVRRRLAELLRGPGLAELFARRLKRAERLFRAVLRCVPGDAAAWLSLASVMGAAGRTSEERRLLSRAAGLARGRHALGDRFKALMKLRRYKAAVKTAERILDGEPGLSDMRCFWDPWEWDERVPREERLLELRAFERALGPAPRGPWLHYYRGSLSGPEGLSHFERLADHPAKRYGWMYFKAGTSALMASKFEKAASWFKLALAGKPADWRAHCFLAEAYLCLNRPEAAFAEMDRALRAAPAVEAGQVLAWRGAFELWLGRYEKALVLLEKAAALGAQCAFCWKGAALLKLGRPAEALVELDRTLRRYPLDFEAYVWRGEAKRALGRDREALKDLDERAMKGRNRTTPVWLWARFNRALAKAALQDEAGMTAEFAAIPAFVIDYIRKTTGLEKKEEILEAGLSLSRGFRRDEYGQAVWMTDRAGNRRR
ncbi:MAG: tetratricopeptide repeat protein, partial [Elusimicrobia bacterium]|nr:tetratricopeptide repeat protein [Elusimicrobiota bacterium]